MAVLLAAGIVSPMTPETIREAIAAGAGGDFTFAHYYMKASDAHAEVFFSTPFSRVAVQAKAASKRYLTLDPAKIEPEALEPYVGVRADAYIIGERITDDLVSIEHAVIASPDGTITQPLSVTKEPTSWTSGAGVKRTGEGVRARFPIAAFRAGSEIRLLLSDGRGEAHFPLDEEMLRLMR